MNELLTPLPPAADVETKAIIPKLIEAHRYLAELKGVVETIPDGHILINTLTLQEAKDSSAIEDIISTFDEIYQSNWSAGNFASPAAKEVYSYAKALQKGFELVSEHELLTNRHILEIQATIENSKVGFRKLPGTALKNTRTGEVVYTPPQDFDAIVNLMADLEKFINNDDLCTADPLIKMALIHYQFESIHPFYDGNGRTGRIINILYLIVKRLLKIPILYMSRFIIKNKSDYYRLLQKVRTEGDWESWIIFMLESISVTAKETIDMILNIRGAMLRYKDVIRRELPKIYSQDLLDNLFRNPYTRIEFVEKDLQVSKRTAIRYLDALVEIGLLEKQKIGRDNYYLNDALIELLIRE